MLINFFKKLFGKTEQVQEQAPYKVEPPAPQLEELKKELEVAETPVQAEVPVEPAKVEKTPRARRQPAKMTVVKMEETKQPKGRTKKAAATEKVPAPKVAKPRKPRTPKIES